MDFKGCSVGPAEELSSVSVVVSALAFSSEGSGPISFSVLLLEVKSKPPPLPGVLGVFAEDPNDAKAPEPRLKAEEAAEGEFVEGVEMVLKGLDLPCEEVSPNRRFVYDRGESTLPSFSGPFIESESLLLLQPTISGHNSDGMCMAYFALRVHKLAFSMEARECGRSWFNEDLVKVTLRVFGDTKYVADTLATECEKERTKQWVQEYWQTEGTKFLQDCATSVKD